MQETPAALCHTDVRAVRQQLNFDALPDLRDCYEHFTSIAEIPQVVDFPN